VVASAVGGIPDYVLPGRNGFLFPQGDLGRCVQAIREASIHSLFSRGQVEPVSLARNRDYLSPPRMAENFLAAYARALEPCLPVDARP
jgi:glycogen synthase